jgi:hypothetical protein
MFNRLVFLTGCTLLAFRGFDDDSKKFAHVSRLKISCIKCEQLYPFPGVCYPLPSSSTMNTNTDRARVKLATTTIAPTAAAAERNTVRWSGIGAKNRNEQSIRTSSSSSSSALGNAFVSQPVSIRERVAPFSGLCCPKCTATTKQVRSHRTDGQ